MGDLNADGIIDLAVGAVNDDGGLLNGGSIWIFNLHQPKTQLTVSPASLVFGDVQSGQTISKTVTLLNSSDQDVRIANIATPDSQFTLSEKYFIIPSGNSKEITITFTPTSVGRISTILTLESADSDNLNWKLPVFAFGTFSGLLNGTGEGGIPSRIDIFTARFNLADQISLTGPIADDEGKSAPGRITHISTTPLDLTLDQIRILRENYKEIFRKMPPNLRLVVEVRHVVVNGDSAAVDAIYYFIARERDRPEFTQAAPKTITFKMRKIDGSWFIMDMEGIRANLATGVGIGDQPLLARLLLNIKNTLKVLQTTASSFVLSPWTSYIRKLHARSNTLYGSIVSRPDRRNSGISSRYNRQTQTERRTRFCHL